MAEITKISWAHSTLNFWVGCTKVSAACDNCYAERDWDRRRHRVEWGPHGDRSPTKTWGGAAKWQRQAAAFAAEHGCRRRVFVNSLSDFFDNHRSIDPAWREAAWQIFRDCPDLDFLLLTKRPQNIAKMLPPDWGKGYPNVWLGTTVENQEEAERRVPVLARIPARCRWLSMEPLLGAVDFAFTMPEFEEVGWISPLEYIDWIICGGESGPGARHFDPEWAADLLAQARACDVAFHMKQLSQADSSEFRDYAAFPTVLQVREVPDAK